MFFVFCCLLCVNFRSLFVACGCVLMCWCCMFVGICRCVLFFLCSLLALVVCCCTIECRKFSSAFFEVDLDLEEGSGPEIPDEQTT